MYLYKIDLLSLVKKTFFFFYYFFIFLYIFLNNYYISNKSLFINIMSKLKFNKKFKQNKFIVDSR